LLVESFIALCMAAATLGGDRSYTGVSS